MYYRLHKGIAIIISAAGLATAALAQQSAQDSAGWRKFGTSSGDQSYALNEAGAPSASPQNSPYQNAPPQQNYSQPAAVPSQITLPAGTFVRVRINEKLSSDKNQAGDLFTATLVQPLIANGLVVAQPGQNIAGRVSEAVKAKDGNGRSRLGLDLTELSLVDGQQIPIRTQLMEYHRATNDGRDTGVVIGTTATGAAIGAVAGGGLGAGVGAITGAAAGAIGVLATRSHATEIHPEAVLTFRTISSIMIATDGAPGAFQPVRQYGYQSQGELQPRQSAVAPPSPYYGGYYDPYYYPYPYGYYPYYGLGLGFYGGYGFGGYGFRGGGFRGGGFGGGGFRGGGRR